MIQRAGAATAGADQKQAQLQAQTDKSLHDLGVISGLTYSASKGKADAFVQRNDIEGQRLDHNQKAVVTQLAMQQTKVQQAVAMLGLRQKQQQALSVRAGIAGVVVDLPHQLGEHVAPGITLAKVVQLDQLKASPKIAETQARDIQIGQPAEVDTHNGIIAGKVTRIDPAVQNGTLTVDVEPIGALPRGARPDLSVDGTIDLDRMSDVLYVGRPAFGNENFTVGLFRVSPENRTATCVPVKVGRASVNSIQVLKGLAPGDTVILSDMSQWDSVDRVRLQNQQTSSRVWANKERNAAAAVPSALHNNLIQIEQLTKVFYTQDLETHTLSGVHLSIARGEYVAMSGPSGCGKPTLLSILGLLDTPTNRQYTLNGKEVANLNFAERSRIRNQEMGSSFRVSILSATFLSMRMLSSR